MITLIDHINNREIDITGEFLFIPRPNRDNIRGFLFRINNSIVDVFLDASFIPEIEDGNKVYYRGCTKIFTIKNNNN